MRPKGLEPPAHCLEGSCSIHLSYGRTLLSHGVLIWRQCAFGTRCEKYNTIRIGFCQAEFQIFLDFGKDNIKCERKRKPPDALFFYLKSTEREVRTCETTDI